MSLNILVEIRLKVTPEKLCNKAGCLLSLLYIEADMLRKNEYEDQYYVKYVSVLLSGINHVKVAHVFDLLIVYKIKYSMY